MKNKHNFPKKSFVKNYKNKCNCMAERKVKLIGYDQTVFCSKCLEILTVKFLSKEDFEETKTDIFL